MEFLCHLLLTLYPSARSQYFVPDTVSFVCMNGRFGGTKTTIVMLVGLLLVGGSCLQKVHIVCNKRNFSREDWRVNNFLFSLYIISEGISTLPPYVYSHAEA